MTSVPKGLTFVPVSRITFSYCVTGFCEQLRCTFMRNHTIYLEGTPLIRHCYNDTTEIGKLKAQV